MESDRLDDQAHDKSAFNWLPVSPAVWRLGGDIYLDKKMKFDYLRKLFHEGYYGNFFPEHTEDRVMKPFIHLNLFQPNCFFHVMVVSNQKQHLAAQPIIPKVKCFETGAVNVMDCAAIALVSIKRLVNFNSDGRRKFDLI